MDWHNLFWSFEGRISRMPFWIGGLILGVIHWVISGIAYGIGGQTTMSVVGGIVSLILIYPSLAVATKRWHDRDKSGWWTLIILIPVVGIIWYIVVLGFLRGTDGPNRYGPDPLTGQ
ncbi:DUF805 domain-containing protein [Microbaculum marinum]|uniref:DUF805 domain-containing protein n=1 Tax=Microbaculum marinum TaxID=1764581 RepID=A0AAW9RPQ9_9HYPH